MSFNAPLFPAAPSNWLAPAESRLAPLFCLVLLAGSCALASFAFACATPFVAFAVVATALLPLSPALLVVTGAWIVNQAIGFGALGYPFNLNTLLWGLAIGVAALVATAESKLLLHSQESTSPAALGVAFFGAFAAYEVVLFAFTFLLGGAGAFTLRIVARIGILNLLWLLGLVAACAVFRLLTSIRRRQMPS
jgi:hypothetical protein